MKVFEKRIQRKVPVCLVCLVKNWEKEQTTHSKRGKHLSEPFHMTRGVRQGGVLSPYLFALHLDYLSTELKT